MICLLSGWTVQAQPRRPFSHKYHLQQVSQCQACHVDAEKSTKADDNLLPFHDACARCHDETHIREPRQSNVQKFNHSVHVAMGNVAPTIAAAIKAGNYFAAAADHPKSLDTKEPCAGCHHGIEQSEAITEKKAHFPGMADCLTCHNQIKPPESCAKCHAASFNLKPASHTAKFADDHATMKHDKPACWSCHGKKFTCKGCH
jgi:hypothetical protein